MKKITALLALSLIAPATFSQTDAQEKSTLTESVMSHIIERDVKQLHQSSTDLRKAIEAAQNDTQRSEAIDQAFTRLVRTWKAVQTVYIAGELDAGLLDTPRLIDAYHNGKEDTNKQLKRLLNSEDPAKIALFKNTFKSINALAFYLYADGNITEKEREYALYTLKALDRHFSTIADSYQQHKADFDADQEQSMSYLLNALIDSAYKLKEWRVGDPAGLSKKYKGTPDNRRQEYPLSQNSLAAIEAILAIHADMMAERPYPNLGSEASKRGATEAVSKIRQLIDSAQNQAKQLRKAPVDFSSEAIKPLFKTLAALNDAYYQSLVAALPVQAKILDADGD